MDCSELYHNSVTLDLNPLQDCMLLGGSFFFLLLALTHIPNDSVYMRVHSPSSNFVLYTYIFTIFSSHLEITKTVNYYQIEKEQTVKVWKISPKESRERPQKNRNCPHARFYGKAKPSKNPKKLIQILSSWFTTLIGAALLLSVIVFYGFLLHKFTETK